MAEQIDRLYWGAGERGMTVFGEEWAERGTDLREYSYMPINDLGFSEQS